MEDLIVDIKMYALYMGLGLTFIGFIALFYNFLTRKKLLKKAQACLDEAEAKAKASIDEAEAKAKASINEAEVKAKRIIDDSNSIASDTIKKANSRGIEIFKKAKEDVIPFEERIERLKISDKEIVARLKEARSLIDEVSDLSCIHAADIELITEDDLLSSQTYQEDRKIVKAKLKKLAINAIDGVAGSNADVNIGKFIAISAKADIAGALLLTTVEMLCGKVTANNGHQAFEKLFESIIATEALVKCVDSRAFVNKEFKELLESRLQIEINFKKARQIARDEQKELRQQEREERKAREEAERIQKEAEKEEKIKLEAIAAIEREMSEKSESDRAVFETQLDGLRKELSEVHERFERARSRAQDTKQGHVYVISNIGCFGEGILKIGMTRRFDPMDRVKELGDASVPFPFDVHALIESDDAPNLENTLHKIFNAKRVNKVNRRKEYFYTNIDDIEEELSELGIQALINKVASADQYYQSLKAKGDTST